MDIHNLLIVEVTNSQIFTMNNLSSVSLLFVPLGYNRRFFFYYKLLKRMVLF